MGKPVITTVPKLWPGDTFVCIGGGPSLTPEDVEYCRGKARVIAVNDAYRLAPWADVLYGCDAKWWKWHNGVPSFQGLKYAMEHPHITWPGVQLLKNTGREGLEFKPTGLKTGSNSGYQAMNLAVHLGAASILLLGYDMQKQKGKDHWFGSHPQGHGNSPYMAFMNYFNKVAPIFLQQGIPVVNCSRHTALTCFPRQPLREALPEPMEQAS